VVDITADNKTSDSSESDKDSDDDNAPARSSPAKRQRLVKSPMSNGRLTSQKPEEHASDDSTDGLCICFTTP